VIELALVIAIVVLQVLDFWTTYTILRAGGRELNKVMVALFDAVGLVPGLLIAKGGFSAAIIWGHLAGVFAGGVGLLLLGGIALFYLAIVAHNLREMNR
jgi:hypothetical protein